MSVVKVPSFSKVGAFHRVQRSEELTCDCIRFDMSKKPKTCRHIELVTKADDLLARCAGHPGAVEGTLCRQCLVALLAALAWKVRRAYVSKEMLKTKRRRLTVKKNSAVKR